MSEFFFALTPEAVLDAVEAGGWEPSGHVSPLVCLENRVFDVQALFRLCRQKLEPNVVPSFIQVLHQIPKTASEKPQERFLLERFEKDRASVHTERR